MSGFIRGIPDEESLSASKLDGLISNLEPCPASGIFGANDRSGTSRYFKFDSVAAQLLIKPPLWLRL
jgi:hypothetical protein